MDWKRPINAQRRLNIHTCRRHSPRRHTTVNRPHKVWRVVFSGGVKRNSWSPFLPKLDWLDFAIPYLQGFEGAVTVWPSSKSRKRGEFLNNAVLTIFVNLL